MKEKETGMLSSKKGRDGIAPVREGVLARDKNLNL